MTPRDRVRMTLEHRQTDRVPRGEILVEDEFLDQVYPGLEGAPWREKMVRLAGEAGLDLVTLRFGPEAGETEAQEIEWWAGNTDRFVVALIDGLFWQPSDPLPFDQYLLELKRDTRGFRSLITEKKRRALLGIEVCLGAGAHGCLLADDIAYDRGPFLSPADLEKWIFPGLEDLAEATRARGGVALLHSCGNLGSLLDRIAGLGFHGLHGLSACAGNDLGAALERTRGRMALMGGADVDAWTAGAAEAFREQTLADSSSRGGYILGSSSGLSRNTPLGTFLALYGTEPGTSTVSLRT